MLPCRFHCDLRATQPQQFNTSRVSAHLVPPARPPCCHWRHSAQHTPPLPRSRNAARDSIVLNASGKPNGNGSNGNGDRTGSSSGTNGSSLEGPQASASGNGGSNGGSIGGSSGGGKSGSNGPGQPCSDDGQNGNGQQSGGFRLPLSRQQLSYAVLGLAALAALMLVNLLRQATVVLALDAAMQTVLASLGGMADGESTRDSVAALKRLLREVFAEQLTIKQRLTDAEGAATAAARLEAADDYALRQAEGPGSSWTRAPVRMSGHVIAAGVLPWSQEANTAGTLAMLSGLGVAGAADTRLQLHSVLAGGKRRVTAEFSQAGQTAALKLRRLLLRVHAKDWLKLMIAPLGGGLEALGRSITPVRGDFGCTQALRHGHGLSVLQQHGSGKAVCLTSRHFMAAAGMFVGGAGKTGIAHLQARSQDGHSLSLVAAHSSVQAGSQAGTDSSAQQVDSTHSLQFLGVQSPHRSPSTPQQQQQQLSGQVLGAAGVATVSDAVTATAWAEKPLSGKAGWGLGLYCRPDQDGLELGMALGTPSAANQHMSRPLFLEVSAKVPVGDGLSISPGATFTYRGGASSLAWVMQSCWRW